MYSIKFLYGESKEKQQIANLYQCIGYLEIEFGNSCNESFDETSASVASNSLPFTRNWAYELVQLISNDFSTHLAGKNGILIGGVNGLHEADLMYANIPAVKICPFCSSHSNFLSKINSKSTQLRIARNIVKSICNNFPNGGLIAFSISDYNYQLPERDSANGNFEYKVQNFSEIILRQASVMLQSFGQMTSVPTYSQLLL
jgi:hypothetical protein